MFQSLPPRIRTFYSFLTDYYAGRLMDDRLPNSQPSQVRPPAARAYQGPTVPPIVRPIPRLIPEPGKLFVFLFEISANMDSHLFSFSIAARSGSSLLVPVRTTGILYGNFGGDDWRRVTFGLGPVSFVYRGKERNMHKWKYIGEPLHLFTDPEITILHEGGFFQKVVDVKTSIPEEAKRELFALLKNQDAHMFVAE